MNTFYDLEQQEFRKIEDRHFTDDSSIEVAFLLMLEKHEFLRDAVNEMLTYIGPIPTKYKDKILYELD